jgi:predicted PurR-regulated permease PerM|tara:strand:+ start:50 stop:319 length:270 start_codon:yes stop_codon:yes gene_type:complete
MLTLSIILTVVVVASFFIIRNLIKQAEKLEDIRTEYEDFLVKQSEAIQACNERLNQIDDKGIFRSDDEVGWFFREVQKIQEALNEFTLK